MKRAYVEITNVCNLQCDFCPGTRRTPAFMRPADFRVLAEKLKSRIRYLYLHLMGEPLLHPHLAEILSIGAELDFRLCITTNGTLLAQTADVLLACSALHKVSVSLHSQEGNDIYDPAYLEQVWDFAQKAEQQGVICVLRLWNLEGRNQHNAQILDFLAQKIGQDPLTCPSPRSGDLRLSSRISLEQARKFDWPDLEAPLSGTTFCQGLRDHLGVLVDGTAVPCCLDHEGDLPLGNLLEQDLHEILNSPKARAIYDGFSRRQPPEELCRRCGYASRF